MGWTYHASIGSPSGMGDPSGGSAWARLLEHTVDLFERKALGFRNEQVGVDEAGRAERAPDEEDFRSQIRLALVLANHVGGDDGNDAVPQPVASGREGDTARADGQGEDLADQNPGAGTPGGGEECDVDADEGDLGRDCRLVVLTLATGAHADDGDDELADQHAQRTPDHNCTAPESLNGPERDGRGADVDKSRDETDQERIADGTKLLEESRPKVKDEVDAGELLHHLS